MENKKSGFSIKRLIYNDKYLIIVSLILAVVIWIGASLNVGTSESKTIKINLPIKMSDEVSEQLGMQYYSLQEEIELSVTISGAKYVIGQVTENDLSVKFDTSAVTKVGTQTIPIRVSNASKRLDFEITDTYPKNIEGYFDVNASKIMNLELTFDKSNVADGYTFGEAVMSEDKVVVSGPKTFVDRIEAARIDVDFGGKENISELYKNDCPIEFIGTGIEHSYLTTTSRTDSSKIINSVNVTIPVMKKTTLPVSIELTDKPSGLDNSAIDIEYSVDTVEAGVLDSTDIESAIIGSVSFNTIDIGTQTKSFDVTKLNGITVLDGTKRINAKITVSNDYERKTIDLDKSKITVEGIKSDELAKVTKINQSKITIIAPRDVDINASDITIKCDVSEKKKTNTYPLTISISNNNAWVLGTYTADIDIQANK